MAAVEVRTTPDILVSRTETFLKDPSTNLFTPDLALHISAALSFPHFEMKEGRKDRMFSITDASGSVGLDLLSPLPAFEGQREERLILKFKTEEAENGLLFFSPTAIVTDPRLRQVTVRRQIGEFESSFRLDHTGHFSQATEIRRPVLVA